MLDRSMRIAANTYARGWDWWWLEEAHADVLRVRLHTTRRWSADDLRVAVLEESLRIRGVRLHRRGRRRRRGIVRAAVATGDAKLSTDTGTVAIAARRVRRRFTAVTARQTGLRAVGSTEGSTAEAAVAAGGFVRRRRSVLTATGSDVLLEHVSEFAEIQSVVVVGVGLVENSVGHDEIV